MAKWQNWKKPVDGDGVVEWAFPKGNVALAIQPSPPPKPGYVVAVKERGKVHFCDGIVHKNIESAHAHADTLLAHHWAALSVLDAFSDADNQPDEAAVWEWADVPNPSNTGGQVSVGVPGTGYVNFIVILEGDKHYIDVMAGHAQLFRDLTSHKTLDDAKVRSDVVWKSNIALLSLIDRSVPAPEKKTTRKRSPRKKQAEDSEG